MPRNAINVKFNLRDPKSISETPVNAIIRYNGQKFTYSTSEKINPKDWQGDKTKVKNYQRAKTSFLQHLEFNSRLDNVEITVKNVFRQYTNDNDSTPPSWDTFKGLLDIALKRTEEAPKDFVSFVERFIEKAKEQINTITGKEISKFTIRKYNTTLAHIKDFMSKRAKKLEFEDINKTFYDEYTVFLKNSYDLATNSIGKDITVIKRFMNAATDAGLNTNLTFKMGVFRSISEKSDNIYLTDEELELIYTLDLSGNQKLERVRDRFLIAAYTALRFSDYSILNAGNIKGNNIEIETYKTGEVVIIPLHPIVKSILKKYNYVLPKSYSNQKTNNYLKDIGKMIPELAVEYKKKITKGGIRTATVYKKYQLITTHTARRSFATNLYKSNFPTLDIMKITGHRTESAFLRYIKTTPNETANRLAKHWESQAEKKERSTPSTRTELQV